ncbi:MAG: hypothetical protein R3253_12805, partial [Longimicrobiales bacterium]|nr:hypothetical protein [Longimicrobiales bacterium]
EPVEGTIYQLIEVGGTAVPGTIPFAGVDVTGGDLVLHSDGSCVRRVSTDPQPSFPLQSLGACQWSLEGQELTLRWSELLTSTGTIEGTELSFFVPTGFICVTFPCPTGWEERYDLSG